MIEELTATPTDPSFSHRVLPWTAIGSSAGFRAYRLDKLDHGAAENGVSIEDQVLRRGLEGESLFQLLDDPGGVRVESDVEMKNPPSIVMYDKPAVKEPL